MMAREENDLQDFEFVNPTKLIFGRGVVPRVGSETAEYGRRALLVSGRASAKASGIYDTVVESLHEQRITVFELSGVLPNPRLAKCLEGVRLCKDEQIDVVVGLRVTRIEELRGLDIGEHGMEAYGGFQIFTTS